MERNESFDNMEPLLLRAQAGDKQAENELTERNMGLVYAVARRFSGGDCDADDLVQVGAMGLFKAIQKFDPSYNVRFSTYAVPMILGEIRRFLRDDGMVKVSRSLKVLAGKAHRARETLAGQYGREPTVGELATHLGVDCAELSSALEATQRHESLYMPCGDSDKLLLIDQVSGGVSHEPDSLDRIAVGEMLSSLPERDRKLIILRYFKDQTQSQAAKRLGISQVQVSRLEKKLLARMREQFSS